MGLTYTAVSIFLVIAIIGAASSYYEYHGFGLQEGVFRHGTAESSRVAALTFDDGPSAAYTPAILDILASKNVKATFFLTGQMAAAYPDIARRVADEGHEVGNHTYSHVNMIFLKAEALADEIDRGHRAVLDATGVKPVLFRPPRGLFNNTVRQALLARGYRIILWSVSAADWSALSAPLIAWRVRHFVRPGAVILFHDGGALVKNTGGKRDKTVAVLPGLIDYLRKRGYTLVTAGELASRH
jgi:peptidoglycan-N-acetylglucosamine deacetylase